MFSTLRKFILITLLLVHSVYPTRLVATEKKQSFFSKVKGWFSEQDQGKILVSKDRNGLKWKRYDYTTNCGFSAEFPESPDHAGQIIELPQSDLTIRYDTYIAETQSDNTVYVVSVWEYPEKVDISRPELNLQEGFSGILQALPESQVLFMQAKEVQGHKALEFWICCEDIYFRGMLISVNHTLYQVFMVYKNKNAKALDKEYDVFTKSFKITKVREAKTAIDLKKKTVQL
ncbi:hypothetical protein [Chlamydia gallinacea]|uniref:Uncharacterized protein n=2 Tax=Chlamydia gallinacea TaxID=1457153 RepID=A0A173E065_9CHLA|nr:hypothetical protein [Chlamydia gallinacea]EYE60269.1 hypothetical protein M127_5085 [Bacteroides fragilis str. S6L5]ANG66582.1 hypothetical protein M787_004590 [Chlamydia gallinacea 08-1274/3]AQT77239.1 hypothetical protein B1F83_01000 [Chlamydia gallinacea]MBX6679932.1 hypothetical protein [Chlamydia gallinacea]MBX6687154.1 hypothetical protein [Chlamydia gallinacea]